MGQPNKMCKFSNNKVSLNNQINLVFRAYIFFSANRFFFSFCRIWEMSCEDLKNWNPSQKPNNINNKILRKTLQQQIYHWLVIQKEKEDERETKRKCLLHLKWWCHVVMTSYIVVQVIQRSVILPPCFLYDKKLSLNSTYFFIATIFWIDVSFFLRLFIANFGESDN